MTTSYQRYDARLREKRIREGLCARCGEKNDRLDDAARRSAVRGGTNGKRTTQCSACISRSRTHRVRNPIPKLSRKEREYLQAQLANEKWWEGRP